MSATITLPQGLRIDDRTEPFVLQEAPFVNQYFLGYMSSGLGWSAPTFLFVERFKAEYRSTLPILDGWVVRAEGGNEGDECTCPMYLRPDLKVFSGQEEFSWDRVWKYKQACTYDSLERAVEVLNWALDLLPDSFYSPAAPATPEKEAAA